MIFFKNTNPKILKLLHKHNIDQPLHHLKSQCPTKSDIKCLKNQKLPPPINILQ